MAHLPAARALRAQQLTAQIADPRAAAAEYLNGMVASTTRAMGRRRPLPVRSGVAVVRHGGVNVCAGDPDDDADVGRAVVFGSTVVDGSSVVVGAEPWWDLSAWPETARSRSLRTQIRRAANKGVHIAPYAADRRADVDDLVRRWLRGRTLAPLGFVVDAGAGAPTRDLGARDVALVADVDGVVVGLVVARALDADSALVEYVVRDAAAPNGTGEALVDAVFRALADRGFARATLGLAPLRDDPQAPLPRPLRFVRDVTGGLFDWHGLEAWKEKLKPTSWTPLSVRPLGVSKVWSIVAVLLAFCRGRPLRFGLLTLLRGPPLFFRVVAALLLPWTLGLALVDERHFPHVAVHAAWVVFDVALASLLFWLAFRIKRRKQRLTLHRLLAVVVGVDAAVTIAQALAWNVPRAETAVDVVVLSAGVLAPLLVDVVLWTSLRFRR